MTEITGNGSRERLSEAELAAWRKIPTAVISDETACMGVMSFTIRSVTPGRRFAGQALTVRTSRVADDAPQRALAAVQRGDVVVIDGSAHPDTAVWGGNLIAGAQGRGAGAVVVDGNVRDIADLRRSDLAVYARSVTPAGLAWGGEVNVPVRCGGVEVHPGALLVGDDDGVVVVSLAERLDLLTRCRARVAADIAAQREAYQSGVTARPSVGERT